MSKKRNNAPADLEPVDTEGELIMTCARLLGLWHEREALRAADEWAPDEGPLHPRYAALDKKEGQFRRRLLGLGIPASWSRPPRQHSAACERANPALSRPPPG